MICKITDIALSSPSLILFAPLAAIYFNFFSILLNVIHENTPRTIKTRLSPVRMQTRRTVNVHLVQSSYLHSIPSLQKMEYGRALTQGHRCILSLGIGTGPIIYCFRGHNLRKQAIPSLESMWDAIPTRYISETWHLYQLPNNSL